MWVNRMVNQGMVKFIPSIQFWRCGQGVERGIYSCFNAIDSHCDASAEIEISADDPGVSNAESVGGILSASESG